MAKALHRLDEARKDQIRALEEKCMEHDGTVHRMYLDPDINLYPEMKCFFLQETAENGVVSVLAVANMEPAAAEITAFTDPAFRRKGLFKGLLKAAVREAGRYGITEFYLVHEQTCAAGNEVLKKLGCRNAKTEYLMEKKMEEGIPEIVPEQGEGLRIVRASESDIPALIPLLGECFHMEEEMAEERLSGFLRDAGRQEYYVWKAVSYGNIAGMCACAIEGRTAALFDVGVSAGCRRRGIGTKLITGALGELNAMGVSRAILQVSGESREAVGLYRRLGFDVIDRLDYYRLYLQALNNNGTIIS